MFDIEKESEMDTSKIRYAGNGSFEVEMKEFKTIELNPQRIRRIVERRMITSGPGFDKDYMPTSDELTIMSDMAWSAIRSGQMIDFGHLPNEAIRAASKLSGNLYHKGALAHPFDSPYILLHSWSDPTDIRFEMVGKKNGVMTCAYLVQPFPESGDGVCIDFEAVILEGMNIHGEDVLSVCDRIILDSTETMKHGAPCCNVIPFAFRFPEEMQSNERFRMMATNPLTDSLLESAMSNVLDPIIMMLGALATRNVPRTTVTVPKLNRQRAKAGKVLIPPYDKVDATDYVSAILNHATRARSEPKGGHHASPVPHVRRGHFRVYASGERSFIHATLVNVTEEARKSFVSNRSHYVVKP